MPVIEEAVVNTNSDQAILDQGMNEQKVNELYKEYQKKMYGLAFSFVKDRYLAEDLSHEILVKCYLSRKKFNGDCSLYSWMYRIAVNHCIDFLRKRSRQRDFLHEDFEQSHIAVVRTPETEVLNICEKEELRNKLSLLPSMYEEVLTLYYFKGQSLKEIETHLKLNLSTIKTRLSRAKKMLREMY
ncbi:RNA polymerase sigma-70 factor, ECF subfamily [Mesobacillus persicus]|uniref:RNA polymerase sigma-70 factor, ECF subfamily n=1 Tax=Mesobacillus persicus TaxID=930146 RepID=A0A1H8AR20_9BACI|nr:sigma-70 family RNA polymerase sigma factor [Mesobacillus persicus]SEM73171.1 RNA polymerase sigma-70 factor, ECF subfamily [Mesobacillus persicus]